MRLYESRQQLRSGLIQAGLGEWAVARGRLAWAAALMIGAYGVSQLWESVISVPGEESHGQFIMGFVLLGCAAAAAQARSSPARRVRAPGLQEQPSALEGRVPPHSAFLRFAEKCGSSGLSGLGKLQFALVTAGTGLALGLLLYWCGMRQFGGYDHSGIIEAGWRLVQGQRPYVDFPCTVPAAFLLGAGYAFKLFGVSWRAIILFSTLFSVATFLWLVWLAARLFGERGFALLLALTVQSLSMLLFSYWWYNPITSVSAAIFLLSAALLWDRPGNGPARLSYAGALTLLALMKPNVAGVLIVGVSAIFFYSKQRRLLALVLSASAFGVFMLILWANHLNLIALLNSYLAVRHYGASGKDVAGLFQTMQPGVRWASYLAAGGALMPAFASVLGRMFRPMPGNAMACWGRREESLLRERAGPTATILNPNLSLNLNLGPCALGTPHVVPYSGSALIGLVGILAGACAFLVNGDTKLVDILPALIGSILIAAEAPGSPQTSDHGPQTTDHGPRASTDDSHSLVIDGRMRRLIAGILLVLSFSGIGIAISRDRVKSIGDGRFFEYELQPGTIQAGFFQGIHTGATFQKVLEETREVLQAHPNATVFFGPRMQWAYAAFNKPSPVGQPMIWAPGAFFPRDEMKDRIESFVRGRFDLVILRKNDLIYYPVEMPRALVRDYVCDRRYSRLTVGRRMSDPGERQTPVAAGTAGYGGWLGCVRKSVLPPEQLHWFLAEAFLDKGETAEAVPELIAALRRDFPEVLDGLAWVRVERLPQALQNGGAKARLLELAERACKLTDCKHPALAGILGCAYAQAGRFDDAVAMVEKARELALLQGEQNRVASNQERVRLFQGHMAFTVDP